MIHVVTDSTCDLDRTSAAALGVHVVPLTVRFGEEQFLDGVDLAPFEFYRRLAAAPETPTTSQPPPHDFAAIYHELLRDPDDQVLSIHISRKLSGTLQSALIAARDVDAARIHPIDSESVTIGLQLLVEAACSDIAAGADLQTVIDNVVARRARLPIYFLLDTLTYLHRGGRIGRAQAFVGGMLKVKPVLSLRDGEVQPQSRVRSQAQGVAALVELARATPAVADLRIVHSNAPELAVCLREALRPAFPDIDPRIVGLGPTVGTYAGPDAVAVACLGEIGQPPA